MNDQVNHPVAKAVSAVAAAGFAGLAWSEIAAILAAAYTSILIGEWLWKRLLRPYLIRIGRITPKPRIDWDSDE